MVLVSGRAAGEAVTVRRAEAADFARLHALLGRYFGEGSVLQRDSDEDVRHYLADGLLGFVIAQRGDELVGCVLCRELPSLLSSCECKRLYVVPECRGQRLASRMMDLVERQAREARYSWMYLDTKDDFLEAIALYEARGYSRCERYNENPQATMFFRKRLLDA